MATSTERNKRLLQQHRDAGGKIITFWADRNDAESIEALMRKHGLKSAREAIAYCIHFTKAIEIDGVAP